MKYLILVSFLIFALKISSQVNAITTDGKNVILNSDGTWSFNEIKKTEIENIKCEDVISIMNDKMTGKSNVGSKKTIIISKNNGQKGFGLYMLKSERGSFILSITVAGGGMCIDEKNKMNVLFKDGTRFELKNDGYFNCKGQYTQYFGGLFGKKSELEMLRTKQIETIRVWTNNGFIEEDLDSEQSLEVLKTFQCLFETK